MRGTGFILAVLIFQAVAAAPADDYRIDPARSEVRIHVGKAGALSFIAGHTHEVAGRIERGTIDVDRSDLSRSRIHLAIATSSLKVSPQGEPPADVPKVQQAMDGEQVLAVGRYPEVIFDSTSVALADPASSAADVTVTGRLTLRGVTNPATVRVHATFDGGTLTAAGRFSIRQTAFGITPIKVAGVVAVKDTLDIEFSIVARRP